LGQGNHIKKKNNFILRPINTNRGTRGREMGESQRDSLSPTVERKQRPIPKLKNVEVCRFPKKQFDYN